MKSGLDAGKGSKYDPQDTWASFISKARPQQKKQGQCVNCFLVLFCCCCLKKVNKNFKTNKQGQGH